MVLGDVAPDFDPHAPYLSRCQGHISLRPLALDTDHTTIINVLTLKVVRIGEKE